MTTTLPYFRLLHNRMEMQAPSWRPSYTWYNPWVSLLSSLLCVAIMFALDPIWGIATMCIMLALGLYIYYRNPDANWGSSVQGQVGKHCCLSRT